MAHPGQNSSVEMELSAFIASHAVASVWCHAPYQPVRGDLLHGINRSARAGPGRSTIQSFCMWVLMLALPMTAACDAALSKTTACDGLVYKDSGLTRAE